MAGLTGRQIAKELGVSSAAVSKAEKVGRIWREADGTFDLERVRIAWSQNTDSSMQRESAPGVGVRPGLAAEVCTPAEEQLPLLAVPESDSLAEARRQEAWEAVRVKRAEAERRENELAIQRGELVKLGPMNAKIAGMIVEARNGLLRIPEELGDRLAIEADPVVCRQILNERITRVLEDLAEYRPAAA